MAETSQLSVVTDVTVVRGRGEDHQIGQIGLDWELFLECMRCYVGGTVEWGCKRKFRVLEQVWGKGSRHGEKNEPKEKNPMAVRVCQNGQLQRSVDFGGWWVLVQERKLHYTMQRREEGRQRAEGRGGVNGQSGSDCGRFLWLFFGLLLSPNNQPGVTWPKLPGLGDLVS